MSYQPYDRNPSGIVFFGNGGTDQVYESISSFTWDNANSALKIPNNGYVGSQDTYDAIQIGTNGNVSANYNFSVAGNLTVNGTTTTVNSTVVAITDPIIILGSISGNPTGSYPTGNPIYDDNKDRGISFNWYDTSSKTGFFGFDDSTGKFTFIPNATITNEVVSGTAGVIVADLEGNADTATEADALSSAVTISLSGQLSGSDSFVNAGDTVYIPASLTAAAITAQSEIASVDGDNDHILIYDSGVGLRKVTPQNFIDDLNIVTSFNVSDGSTDVIVNQNETLNFADGDGAGFVVTEATGEPTITVAVDNTVIRTSTTNGQTITQDLIFNCSNGSAGYFVSGQIPTLSFVPGSLGTWIDFNSQGPGAPGDFYIVYDNSNGYPNDSIIIHAGDNVAGDIRLEPGDNGKVIIGENAPAYDSSGVELHTLTSTGNAATYFYTNISGGGNTVYKRSTANVKSDLGLSNVENIAVSTLGGSGLYYGGSQLNVGAGNGITVAADSVALASTVAGSGLNYSAGVLNIGGGIGISIDSTTVYVDETVISERAFLEATGVSGSNDTLLIYDSGTALKQITVNDLIAGADIITDFTVEDSEANSSVLNDGDSLIFSSGVSNAGGIIPVVSTSAGSPLITINVDNSLITGKQEANFNNDDKLLFYDTATDSLRTVTQSQLVDDIANSVTGVPSGSIMSFWSLWDGKAGDEHVSLVYNLTTLTMEGASGIDVNVNGPYDQVAITLEPTTVTAGSYGDASGVANFTVDANGRLTSASRQAISITSGQVSDFNTAVEDVIFTDANFIDSTTIDFTVPSGAAVTAIVKDGSISNAKLRDSTGLSVIGRSANTTGDPADIVASTDHHVLRRSGTSLGFGLITTNNINDGAVTEAKVTRTVASVSTTGELSSDINLVTAGAGLTVTLPNASGNEGRIIYVKKTDATSGAVTIDTNGGNIDGASQKILYSQFEGMNFVSDNSNWFIV